MDPSGTIGLQDAGPGSFQPVPESSLLPVLQDIHYELAGAYISARDSFLGWWSDAKQLGAGFGEGFMDGVELVNYGGTFGIMGDTASINALKKKYGVIADVSMACGGVTTVSVGTATIIEFSPFLFAPAKALATKYATGDPDVYSPIKKAVSFDWNRVDHIFRDAKGHVNSSDVTDLWRWAKIFEEIAADKKYLIAPTDPRKINNNVLQFVKDLGHGVSIWVETRYGMIQDAGMNFSD